jgi:hypothetical protein
VQAPRSNRMVRSFGFPDPNRGEYLKTTAECAETAEGTEGKGEHEFRFMIATANRA